MSAPPDSESGPPDPELARVFRGYTILRAMMCVLYLGMQALAVWALTGDQIPEGGEPMPLLIGGVGIAMGFMTLASFRFPRAPWAWSAHMAVIILGVGLCVTAPFSLVLVYSWLHPKVRGHFGVELAE